MYFEGKVWKEGKFWLAEVMALDVATQGETRAEALEMIADAIETLVDKPGFKVQVYEGVDFIAVSSDDVTSMIALLIRRLREKSGLTLAQAAELFGSSSPNTFARYEYGKAKPTFEMLLRLCRAIAPDLDLGIGLGAHSTGRQRAKLKTTSARRHRESAAS